jgi:hypothetical protein
MAHENKGNKRYRKIIAGVNQSKQNPQEKNSGYLNKERPVI